MNTLPYEALGDTLVALVAFGAVIYWFVLWVRTKEDRLDITWSQIFIALGVFIAAIVLSTTSILRWTNNGMLTPQQAFQLRSGIRGGILIAVLAHYFWRWR